MFVKSALAAFGLRISAGEIMTKDTENGRTERAQVLPTAFEQSLPPEALELLKEAQKRGGMGEAKPLAHHERCA